MTAAFVQEYHSAISCVYIEAGRAGVRLPSGVQLPPLAAPTDETPAEAGEIMCRGIPPAPEVPTNRPAELLPESGNNSANGHTPQLTVVPPAGELPTSIPAGLQLPCAEALIADLRPPQLSLLIGKVGLRALADKSLEPLHVALLAKRARRFAQGQRGKGRPAEAHGDVP
jgi:hypothetical protein